VVSPAGKNWEEEIDKKQGVLVWEMVGARSFSQKDSISSEGEGRHGDLETFERRERGKVAKKLESCGLLELTADKTLPRIERDRPTITGQAKEDLDEKDLWSR